MERRIARTLTLENTLYEADKEINELEFLEPTAKLFDEMERIDTWNGRTKKIHEVKSMSLALLAHLTDLHTSTLERMSFADRKAANAIIAEIMGAEVETGEA